MSFTTKELGLSFYREGRALLTQHAKHTAGNSHRHRRAWGRGPVPETTCDFYPNNPNNPSKVAIIRPKVDTTTSRLLLYHHFREADTSGHIRTKSGQNPDKIEVPDCLRLLRLHRIVAGAVIKLTAKRTNECARASIFVRILSGLQPLARGRGVAGAKRWLKITFARP